MSISILVSLCNTPYVTTSPLLCIQFENDIQGKFSYAPVQLGYPDLVSTATGLAYGKGKVFVVFSSKGKFFVSVLREKDLLPLFYQELPEIKDGHSVLAVENTLYIVSTGTNEVVSYRIFDNRLGRAQIFWSLDTTKTNTHHINSIAEHNGSLPYS